MQGSDPDNLSAKGKSIIQRMGRAAAIVPESATDTPLPLDSLIEQIIQTHHVFVRRHLLKMAAIIEQITDPAYDPEPRLLELRRLFLQCAGDFDVQLQQEEMVLFPMLRRLELQTVLSRCHTGMVQSRIRFAESGQARLGEALLQMNDLLRQQLSPAGPCEICHELIPLLNEFRADLRVHIHKEQEILFPRAIQLEAMRSATGAL